MGLDNTMTVQRCIGCEDLDNRGIIPAVTALCSLATKICTVVGSDAQMAIPYISLSVAPISIYQGVQSTQKRFKNAKMVESKSEKIFWGLRAISSVGNMIGSLLPPFLIPLELAKHKMTATATLVFKTIMPQIFFATNCIGFVTSSWALNRTIVDYKNFKKNVTTENVRNFISKSRSFEQTARFNESHLPYKIKIQQLTDKDLMKAMTWASRFSLYDHTNTVVIAIIGIAATCLCLYGGSVCVRIGAYMMIASPLLSLTALTVKNILIHKTKKLYQASAITPSTDLLASSEA